MHEQKILLNTLSQELREKGDRIKKLEGRPDIEMKFKDIDDLNKKLVEANSRIKYLEDRGTQVSVIRSDMQKSSVLDRIRSLRKKLFPEDKK